MARTLRQRVEDTLRRPAATTARIVTRDEAFRVVRSNLEVAIADLENPVVVVTSANAGEGKTSTCVNLAESLATAGRRVVLVDLDLRKPNSHRLLGAHNERGVSDVLLDRIPLEECLQYVELVRAPATTPTALYFLSSGAEVHNPTELLGTARMGHLLNALAAQADIVLLDTPPVLPVADTLVIGRLAAGAVLVVETRRTPVPAVEHAKAALTRNQTRLLGVVVNKLQPRDARTIDSGSYGYGLSPSPATVTSRSAHTSANGSRGGVNGTSTSARDHGHGEA